MKKEKETSPEQHLRDLVAGQRSDIPEEGLPGVPIVYQSGPVRIHDSRTKGPVFISAEREVLVDVELVAGAGGIAIERVRFGWGPRTWRFPSPSDPPPRRKPIPPPKTRLIYPPVVTGPGWPSSQQEEKTPPQAPEKRGRKSENPFLALPNFGREADRIYNAPSQQEDAET